MMLEKAKDASVQHQQKTEWLGDAERSKTFAA